MKNPLKVLSLFSGIGAFEKALNNLNVSYELVNYSDIDSDVSKAYSLIHNVSEDKNLGDVTQIKEMDLPEVDLITYGFPCQDISFCGNKKGLFDEYGNKTRSGLFYDALRIINATNPKVAIAENVKALTSARFKSEFKELITALQCAGNRGGV